MRTKLTVKKLGIALLLVCSLTSCKNMAQTRANNQHKVVEISLGDKSLLSSYSAQITGQQYVEIRPQVSGLITKVCITEGATIKRGQQLFIIDRVPYQAALETALANVASASAKVATARLTVSSKEQLRAQDVVSDFDLMTAKNDLLMAKAALAQAKAQETSARNDLSYTVIKSPVDGAAGMISYRVGTLVNSAIATPLVTVSDNARMYVYFSMTENQLLALGRQRGSTEEIIESMPEVELKLNDGTIYNHKGRIDAISGMIDASTGAISVRANFPNPEKMLRSGGTGSLLLPYDRKNCIVIEQQATYEIQDKKFVYRVVDGVAVSTPITVLDINDGREYIVESGLKVGDVIVAQGAGLLKEGAVIVPMTADTTNNK